MNGKKEGRNSRRGKTKMKEARMRRKKKQT